MESAIARGVMARRFLDWSALLPLCLVLLFALIARDGYAQVETPKQKAIRELVSIRTQLEATTWDRLSEPLVMSARAANPTAAPELWDELRFHVKGLVLKAAAGPGGPSELIIRRYDERFSEEEVQQLLTFFSSDVGKKFTIESSVLQQDLETANALFLVRFVPQLTRDLERFFQQRGLRMPR